MTKNDVVKLLGGTTASAVVWLGVAPQTFYNWATDKRGNLTSRAVRDKVLAAGVKKNVKDRLARGEPVDPFERKLVQ